MVPYVVPKWFIQSSWCVEFSIQMFYFVHACEDKNVNVEFPLLEIVEIRFEILHQSMIGSWKLRFRKFLKNNKNLKNIRFMFYGKQSNIMRIIVNKNSEILVSIKRGNRQGTSNITMNEGQWRITIWKSRWKMQSTTFCQWDMMNTFEKLNWKAITNRKTHLDAK